MAAKRDTAITQVIRLFDSTMGLFIQDDDKSDIWIDCLDGGIRFSNWSGGASVSVFPVRNNCAETVLVKFNVTDPEFHDMGYNAVTDAFQVCQNIYDFIQKHSRNGV